MKVHNLYQDTATMFSFPLLPKHGDLGKGQKLPLLAIAIVAVLVLRFTVHLCQARMKFRRLQSQGVVRFLVCQKESQANTTSQSCLIHFYWDTFSLWSNFTEIGPLMPTSSRPLASISANTGRSSSQTSKNVPLLFTSMYGLFPDQWRFLCKHMYPIKWRSGAVCQSLPCRESF